MAFIADKQTLEDLNVLGKYKQHSLFSIFNQTSTSGGERLLNDMFLHPLTDHTAINKRIGVFSYFQQLNVRLPFAAGIFSQAEQFLSAGNGESLYVVLIRCCRRHLLRQMGVRQEYDQYMEGVKATLEVLQQLASFFSELAASKNNPLYNEINTALQLLQKNNLTGESGTLKHSGMVNAVRLDYLLRSKMFRELSSLLSLVYQLDVVISVTSVARQCNFNYPEALPSADEILNMQNVRHPALLNPVGNDLRFRAKENVLFLTGANMAGKSTLMKSAGCACYLAHMGFPVPADSLLFSVKAGIYSSINVPDNLNQGISHFYAEVLRVKEVASSVCEGLPLLVIFDELFKGTNVKDAYEATLEVTKAFGLHRKCNFIISTHIIETGSVLSDTSENICFAYMPTVMSGTVPQYSYKLQEGITEDRQGMMIIRNEGILNM